jgi:hypothetical protein
MIPLLSFFIIIIIIKRFEPGNFLTFRIIFCLQILKQVQ